MRWLTLILAFGLCGCKSEMQWQQQWDQERVALANAPVPTNYKTDIVAFMRTYLNDPTDVRGAFVSEPAQREFEGTPRFASCLRYNAKKGGGQYAGSKDSIVLYRIGRLDRVVDNARDTCKDAAYLPFPELERMTR